jgi:hypothetical protein
MSTLHLDFYSISLLKQQSAGRHVGSLEHIIPITIQHRLCSYSLVLHVYQTGNKYQFYILWFDPTLLEPTIYHTSR